MARPRKNSAMPNVQIGLKSGIGKTRESFVKNYFERRNILRIPPEIEASNPDKHFCFVNMNKLQKNGMWHSGGYQLYRSDVDPESQYKEKFNQALDPYIHRNELVLAYIPKEEFELRQFERDVAKGKRDLSDIITKDSNMHDFKPYASLEEEIVTV